jgi:hypothetical protein
MRPVSFVFNDTNERTLGFIAEEAALIDDRLITRNEQGVINGINPDVYIPILTKAIQEMDSKINNFNQVGLSAETLDQMVIAGGLEVGGEVDFAQDTVGEVVVKESAQKVNVIFEKQYKLSPIITLTPMDFVTGQYKGNIKQMDWYIISLCKQTTNY